MKVPELAARSLDDANLVGPRVVPVEAKPSIFRPKTIWPIHFMRSILVQHRPRRRRGIGGWEGNFQRTGSGGAAGRKSRLAVALARSRNNDRTHVLQSVVGHFDCP